MADRPEDFDVPEVVSIDFTREEVQILTLICKDEVLEHDGTAWAAAIGPMIARFSNALG